MLPNFTTEAEVAGYAALVGGRAEVVPWSSARPPSR